MQIKNIALKVAVLSAVIAVFPVLAQEVEPKPTCNHCSGCVCSQKRAGRL